MAGREETTSIRTGIRGWKAFLIVVASGVTAALVVLGLATGIFRMFSFGFSSPSAAPKEQSSWAPPDELGEGELDLCDRTVSTLGSVKERTDSGKNYKDTGVISNKGERVVSDECAWTVTSSKGRMNMEMSYEATLASKGEDASREINSIEYQRRKNEAEKSIMEPRSMGSLEDIGKNSHYFFGKSNQGGNEFVFVGGAASGAYTIRLNSDDSLSDSDFPISVFFEKIRDVAPSVQIDLERWAAY